MNVPDYSQCCIRPRCRAWVERRELLLVRQDVNYGIPSCGILKENVNCICGKKLKYIQHICLNGKSLGNEILVVGLRGEES